MFGAFQNIDPPPLTARRVCTTRLWCGRTGGGHGWRGGWGVNILEDARHSTVLYICKYFVVQDQRIIRFFQRRTLISSNQKKSLKKYEENLQESKQDKNPRNSTDSLQVTGAVPTYSYIQIRIPTLSQKTPQSIPNSACISQVPSILLVILLGLGFQIKIFGEASPNSKKS